RVCLAHAGHDPNAPLSRPTDSAAAGPQPEITHKRAALRRAWRGILKVTDPIHPPPLAPCLTLTAVAVAPSPTARRALELLARIPLWLASQRDVAARGCPGCAGRRIPS